MRWAIKHKSGRTLFVTSDEFIANNRRKMGWIVEKVKMTSREQFEAWATNAGFIVTTKNDGYLYPATNSAWQAWRASRAAIEIEFPERHYFCDNDGSFFAAEEIIYDIEQAGLKVKK